MTTNQCVDTDGPFCPQHLSCKFSHTVALSRGKDFFCRISFRTTLENAFLEQCCLTLKTIFPSQEGARVHQRVHGLEVQVGVSEDAGRQFFRPVVRRCCRFHLQVDMQRWGITGVPCAVNYAGFGVNSSVVWAHLFGSGMIVIVAQFQVCARFFGCLCVAEQLCVHEQLLEQFVPDSRYVTPECRALPAPCHAEANHDRRMDQAQTRPRRYFEKKPGWTSRTQLP